MILRSPLARDRAIVVAGIVLLAGLAWFDLWQRAGAAGPAARADVVMPAGTMMTMAMGAPWNLRELIAAGLMWSVMMVAMMLPSTAPLLFLFAGAQRTRRAQGGAAVPAGLLVAGYLVIWSAWSWLAASLQWALQSLSLLSGDLVVTRAALGGAFLVLAGVYQFTPLKQACLARCQSPLGFLMTQWREGSWGAVWMGVLYGGYCVGCCWALMGLLFAAGVMNLVWIAALAVLVLVEKAGRGLWLSRGVGVVLTAWGVFVLGAGLLRR